MLKKIISFLFIALFVITPLLVYHRTSELFEFNKMLYIYLTTGLITSLWIYEMISLKKIILKKTPLDLFILIFLAIQILSTIFSIDQHTSIFGYYGRFNGGLLSTFCYVALYYAFTSHIGSIFNREWVLRLFKVSLVTSFIVVLWGISGWIGYDASCALFTGSLNNSCWTESFKPALRMFSTLGQPNWLGAYLVVNVSFCLYFLSKATEVSKKYFSKATGVYLILLFFLSGGVFATKSRSAILALFVVLCLSIIIKFFKKKSSSKERIIFNLKVPAIILIAVLTSLLIFKTGIPVIDKIITPIPKNAHDQVFEPNKKQSQILITKSSDIRKLVWEGAIKLGVQYPLFGTGVETFGYSYYFARPIAHNLTSEWDFLYNRAHNEYLNYLATSGFLGFGSYVLLLGACLFVFYKNHRKNHDYAVVPLVSGFIGILITNFFGFSTSTSSLFLFLIPAFVLTLKGDQDDTNEEEFKMSGNKIVYLLPLFIGVYSLWFVYSYFQADINYNLGSQYLDAQDFSNGTKYLQKALSHKYEHVYEDKLAYAFAQGALVTASSQDDNNSNTVQELIEGARYYNQKTINASPKNLLYYKTASKINFLSYQLTKDENDLEMSMADLAKAESFAPTEPKIPYTKALFLSSYFDQTNDASLKRKLIGEALDNVNKAISLKKNYRDAYLLKSAILLKSGDERQAKQALNYILTNIEPNDNEVKAELEKIK